MPHLGHQQDVRLSTGYQGKCPAQLKSAGCCKPQIRMQIHTFSVMEAFLLVQTSMQSYNFNRLKSCALVVDQRHGCVAAVQARAAQSQECTQASL